MMRSFVLDVCLKHFNDLVYKTLMENYCCFAKVDSIRYPPPRRAIQGPSNLPLRAIEGPSNRAQESNRGPKMNAPENSDPKEPATPDVMESDNATSRQTDGGSDEDAMPAVVFDEFVNDMTVKLKECVRSELNVLLKQQQSKSRNNSTVEKNGTNEPTQNVDGQSPVKKVKNTNEAPEQSRDEGTETNEAGASTPRKKAGNVGNGENGGNFSSLGFEAFTDDMASKLEEIVLSELVEITKQGTSSEAMPQHGEVNTIYSKPKNAKSRESKDVPTPRKSSKLQFRSNEEHGEENAREKCGTSAAGETGRTGIQSLGNNMVSRIETIVRDELSSLSAQIQELRHNQQQQRQQIQQQQPASITFVTINGKPDFMRRGNRRTGGTNNITGRDYSRSNAGDMDFKVEFVNKLVKRIERSVKCELIVMSTQKDVIPNITRRLDVIGREIDGVRKDVMTLHGYASCVDDVTEFRLPDSSIQDGVMDVKMELLRLSEAMDLVVEGVTKLTEKK